jgi:hypothetical protein
VPGPQPPFLIEEEGAPEGPQFQLWMLFSWFMLFINRPALASCSVWPCYYCILPLATTLL